MGVAVGAAVVEQGVGGRRGPGGGRGSECGTPRSVRLKKLKERVQLERDELRRERAEERERRRARDEVHPDAEPPQARRLRRVDSPLPSSRSLSPSLSINTNANLAPGVGVGAVREGDLERLERREREARAEDRRGLRAVRDEVGHGADGGRDEDVRVEGVLRGPRVPEAREAVCGEAVQPLDVFPDDGVRAGVQGEGEGEEADEVCEVWGCVHRPREEASAASRDGEGRVGGVAVVAWSVTDGVVQQDLSGERPGAADERGDAEGRVRVQMVEDLEEDVVAQSRSPCLPHRHDVECQRHPVQVCAARHTSSAISAFYISDVLTFCRGNFYFFGVVSCCDPPKTIHSLRDRQ